MPNHVVRQLEQAYGDLAGARVVVLGAAYRADVKETAFSGIFPLVAELKLCGAMVTCTIPFTVTMSLGSLGFAPHSLGSAVDEPSCTLMTSTTHT